MSKPEDMWTTGTLVGPVTAVQYSTLGPDSRSAVEALVASVGGVVTPDPPGTRWLLVEYGLTRTTLVPGDHLVRIGNTLAVLTPGEYWDMFKEIDPQ